MLIWSDDPLGQYLGAAYPRPGQGILSPGNAKMVRDYLKECKESHPECSPGGDADQTLPTRLIKIERTREGKSLRLVNARESELDPLETRYAALSYRWGSRPFLSTTQENLQDHLRCIPVSPSPSDGTTSALPQGFSEIVDICWDLGVQYLWIDALCIIQGDAEDWSQESARMHQIYAQSWLTLVLAHTESPHVGFLQPIEDPSRPVIEISYVFDPSSGRKGSLFIQRLSYNGELEYPAWNSYLAAEDDIDVSPWNSRGWTLQERLLPTRTLYIGINEMLGLGHVCCRRIADWGREKNHIKAPRRHKSLEKLRIRADLAAQDLSPPPSHFDMYQEWHRIVEDYSCRNLTQPSDKLAAISGLARLNGGILGPYIAGLWVRNIAMDLTWKARYASSPGADRYHGMREPQPFRRPPAHRAPTWSWAANEGQVEFPKMFDHAEADVEIKSCRQVPRHSQDPFGPLSTNPGERAFLEISGRLKAVTMDGTHGPGYQKRSVSDGTKRLDSVALDHEDTCLTPSTVWVLRVVRGRQGEWQPDSVGLVLRRTDNETRPEYERIGSYSRWSYGISSFLADCKPQTIFLV